MSELKPLDRQKFSFADMHRRVLAQHAPPSVVVNHDSNIVHMSDRVGRFLHHGAGEPSRDLVSLVRPELRLELRAALFQAIQSGRSVETHKVLLKRGDRMFCVGMVARPFRDDDAAADFVLVLFEETEQAAPPPETPVADGDKKDLVLTKLEEELQRTKEHLQDTVEHSETSTEELKASNEELQAINEELRSATEELETSKEELQSVNEELITVNYELKVKVEETGKVNDDLNNLIASTDIATIFVDRGMRIKRYTPRVADIFSIIASDIGRSLLDITHRLDYEQLADDAAATFETLRLVEREVRAGDGRVYIVRMLPYRTVEDRIEGAVMTFFDITGRRLAEEKLRAGEERMQLVAESTKDYAIITSDTEGRITSFNKGAERIFGYTEAEMLGQMDELIFTPEDRASGVPAEERRRAREDGRAEDERWHLRKDGTTFYCSGVMSPLRDGEFYGYAKIARDLTGRVRADSQRDEQLSREQISRAEAQAASALKDEFLAIMSHELKHPLNLIHMNAELLLRLPEIHGSQTGTRVAETIRSSAVSQAKIINDLLDLSRLNTGKLTLALSDMDLAAVVRSIVDVAKTDPAASNLAISMTDPGTPVLMHADVVRIEQVIWNLMNNAIKFTPPDGSIAVRLTQEENFARLDVIDDGQGIAPDFLPHVFDMFGQGMRNMSRGTSGLGIGLALVKQIVNLHGGRVEAASDGTGHGTRFSLFLPLCQSSACAAAPAVPENSVAGLKILLLDDMEDTATTFKLLLELSGATVETATNARLALKMLGEQTFDLVMSDIGMPDMDGYAFVKEMRKLPNYKKTPAIAVTGFGRLKDAERAHEAGFSAHIGKPISMEQVLETVGKLRNADM